MIFNSLEFLIFFGVVLGSYYLLSDRTKIIFLLLASCFFYSAFIPAYLLILFFLIGIDFFLAQKIEGSEGRRRTQLFIVSLAANLLTLFFFKYFNFASENLTALAHLLNWNYSLPVLQIILPIGLSFHIFQSLSYVIEVYRGKQKAERALTVYALYVMFFPQLVAGPIERPQNLLHQFHEPKPFIPSNVTHGLELMLWGFIKKLLIADNIAIIVDRVYATLPTADGPLLILTLFLFSYQLYCDFSGYSDIAKGSARVLGYELMDNFNRPYAARSVADFWRRWHISLSTWLRDYLYYPLAFSGARVTKARLWTATFITFTLIGLWHGANWTFIMLGVTHGTYLVFGSATENFRKNLASKIGLPKLHAVLKVLTVFILVSLSWVFFRAPSMDAALTIFKNLGTNLGALFDPAYLRYSLLTVQTLGVTKMKLLGIFASIGALEFLTWRGAHTRLLETMRSAPRPARWALYYIGIVLIVGFGALGAPSFIYFQF